MTGAATATHAAKTQTLGQQSNITFNKADHSFTMKVDGKSIKLSAMEAVIIVFQNRYKALSDATADKAKEMQDQVQQINEARKLAEAAQHPPFKMPPGKVNDKISKWLTANGIDLQKLSTTDGAKKLPDAAAKLNNYVDQLSSTNELKTLSLKTINHKAEQAMTAASNMESALKRLIEGINQNIR